MLVLFLSQCHTVTPLTVPCAQDTAPGETHYLHLVHVQPICTQEHTGVPVLPFTSAACAERKLRLLRCSAWIHFCSQNAECSNATCMSHLATVEKLAVYPWIASPPGTCFGCVNARTVLDDVG